MRGHVVVGVALTSFALVGMASAAEARTEALSGRIAFESTRTGSSDIWVMTPDGKDQVDLTKTPKAQESTPALSPDGKRIAFVRSTGQRYELWVMNADGTGQRRLGSGKGSDLNPAWSPNGDRIAFASLVGRNWDVFVTDLQGNRKQLTGDSAAEVDVSWDPNAKRNRLVVDRIAKGTSDLWLLSVARPKLVQLTRTANVAELNPAWSPKGSEIAYDATLGGRYDLFSVDVSTREVRQLTHDSADDGDPSWSPDGSSVVYRRSAGPDYELAIISSSGQGKPRNVSRDRAGLDIAPSWSNAGGAVAALRAPAVRARRAEINWTFACDAAWPGTTAADNYAGNLNGNHMCGDGAGDTIHGSYGADWISGGGGTDYLYGDADGDHLKARDSTLDHVRGGYGLDYALLDSNDDAIVEYPSY